MTAALRETIAARLGLRGATWRRTGQSAWASTYTLNGGAERYFVKLARHPTRLACEADGLRELARTGTVRVPGVVAHGCDGDEAWLVLEWLDIGGATPSRALGAALARLHRAQAPSGPRRERFGWHRDNWLGGTPQANAWCDDWCTFFRERRLMPQLALADANGFRDLAGEGERLIVALPSLLGGHEPTPSLLHGDLWSGNAAMLASGEGVVFDPAVYVGDREADLAMTELFGGLGEDFRRGYEDSWPLVAGYALRRDAYNLYHLLNHVNLFGRAYVARTRRTLSALLGAAGH
ncbi:MAG TPA: fructosamine kinase family protein [Casimicrobiaceae bacterium]|nr:fructosamine kinase family protein [Casimicrobiaceae bacterium]